MSSLQGISGTKLTDLSAVKHLEYKGICSKSQSQKMAIKKHNARGATPWTKPCRGVEFMRDSRIDGSR